MVIECFGHLATAFLSPNATHQVMQRPDVLVPQRVGEPCLTRAPLHRRDVYVVRRIEILGLRPQFRLHVVEWKFLSASQPGAVSEQGCGPVIHVEIDRPMGEDDIWFVLVQEYFGEFFVALPSDFRPVGGELQQRA